MKIKHSLVVPCYNEEGNVEEFLHQAKKAMSNYTDSYEIVFVNDGSKDRTPDVLKKLFNENKELNIKVINFSRNFGKEAAMYAGLSNSSGEYVTIIDADLQQDPKYAVEMARILDENPDCDMVAAFQNERKEGKAISKLKRMFYKFIDRFSGIDFISDASDFRTMRRSVVETILSLTEYQRFSKGIFSWIGYNTVSIPYDVKERQSGETKWSFVKLVKYALEGIFAYTNLPLKIPYFLSSCAFIVSVILFTVFCILDYYIVDGVYAYGYIISAILFVSSVILFVQGVICSYISRIHTQVKNRPIFIAKEILTYEHDKDSHN